MISDHLHDALRQLATEALPVRIAGACMHPHVQDGARVRVRAARWYWPGDVVVYRNGQGMLVAHRLLGYYRRQGCWRLLIQADTARRPDQGVPLEQVLGKAAEVKINLRQRLWALSRYLRHAFSRPAPRRAP